MNTTYPRIEKMMAGYINMDACEIAGSPNLNDQVAYYTTRVSPKALRALLLELDQYEREHCKNLTDSFEDEFDYGANIPDAQAFFDLVRREVDNALGESSKTETLVHPKPNDDLLDSWPLKASERSYHWVKEPTETEIAVFIDSVKAELSRKRSDNTPPIFWDNFLHHKTSLIIEDDKTTFIPQRAFHSAPRAPLPMFDGFLQIYELNLLHKAQETPVHMRLTKEYVALLEILLEIKGVKLKKTELDSVSKEPNNLIDCYLQRHERKLTR
ncbi:hypothetical protein F3J27_09125 [Enterobacter sp. Ap-916]|uniref:hypothetical protein n=1 Tax=unclassified Enterobacter TaxID=2608935 RepID=UPI00141E9A04|nr:MULTISPECIES: hypothetical protein [unclassified Enterobacter]NIF58942.1 hypothetical protein [Enterobacter sp. Ap-867]NIG29642.1 hypothetical protein [Enterobacter sp. Ap-916]